VHALAARRGWDAPIVEQPQYSLLARHKFEDDVLPAAKALGMGLVVWSPLASGILSGKYDDGVPEGSRLARMDWLREGLTDEKRERVKAFKAIADDVGTTRARLAIAWALAKNGVSSVILGATTNAQLDENLAALKVQLTDDVKARLEAVFA
jgi:aryl-alcohol dehydrogenase-like predicted oxidoreductase